MFNSCGLAQITLYGWEQRNPRLKDNAFLGQTDFLRHIGDMMSLAFDPQQEIFATVFD
jgi:hypothetical protein